MTYPCSFFFIYYYFFFFSYLAITVPGQAGLLDYQQQFSNFFSRRRYLYYSLWPVACVWLFLINTVTRGQLQSFLLLFVVYNTVVFFSFPGWQAGQRDKNLSLVFTCCRGIFDSIVVCTQYVIRIWNGGRNEDGSERTKMTIIVYINFIKYENILIIYDTIYTQQYEQGIKKISSKIPINT